MRTSVPRPCMTAEVMKLCVVLRKWRFYNQPKSADKKRPFIKIHQIYRLELKAPSRFKGFICPSELLHPSYWAVMVLFALLEQIKATDTVENRSITLSCLSTHCVDLCYINHFDWCNSPIARNEVYVETVEDCSPFYLRVLANAPQTLTALQPLELTKR